MSRAANVPIISDSISRNAAIYSGTRFFTATQLASTHSGIRNTESSISISAMPSIPSDQFRNGANSGRFSVNWKAAVV